MEKNIIDIRAKYAYDDGHIEKAVNTLDKNNLTTEELIKKGLAILGK